MKEAPVLHRVLLACSRGATRLFRVNTGVAWAGKSVDQIRGNGRMVLCNPGDVVVRAAQPIRMGLCNGGSDAVGWTTYTISDCDAGAKVAVFTAIETKSTTGRASEEQLQFIEQVKAAGGIAGVARSDEDALAIIAAYRPSDRC